MGDEVLSFEATESSGDVSAILRRPDSARYLYVLAHGAGAGMRHRFMESVADALAVVGVATFRYQFPYIEAGKRAPSPRPILLKTVRSAVAAARQAAPDLALIAGGKSMGGRMTSLAASEAPLPGVKGLVFLGFPLHPPGRPSSDRGYHLRKVGLPMLFVQGTRDNLANLELLEDIIGSVEPRPKLHTLNGADHSFGVRVHDYPNGFPVFTTVARVIADWIPQNV